MKDQNRKLSTENAQKLAIEVSVRAPAAVYTKINLQESEASEAS
jgi:hypothetical protein